MRFVAAKRYSLLGVRIRKECHIRTVDIETPRQGETGVASHRSQTTAARPDASS